jgi:hypothetical protein
MIQYKKNQKGVILIYLIVTIAIFLIVMTPLTANFLAKMKLMELSVQREQAFQIAEAGINYYQWHLAHYPDDYQDGTGLPGPYVHDYTDFDTQTGIGKFSLEVEPPLTGSTIVTIQSTGWINSNPGLKKTITVEYGIPSLAKYAILNNGEVWIYFSPQTFSGQVHSNSGVRFDVDGNAPIYSAKSTYSTNCFDNCTTVEKPGVWGSGNSNFWQFPVPAVDFSAFTSNLADLKNLAETAGIYLPPSNAHGYSLVFNSNGTVSVYKVDSLLSNPGGWTYDINMVWTTKNKYTDYSNRILQYTVAIPSNGIIYIEDNVWVEGTVNGRATVAAAQLPYNSNTAPIIYIPNNIVYSSKDGSSVLGLIGQKDVIPTYHAPSNLEVDAAVISQNSSFQFYYYPNNIKNSINIYGSIIEFGWWFDNFVWTSGINSNVIGGYAHSYYNYDSNLLYGPPPSFPLSSSGYQQINWISN